MEILSKILVNMVCELIRGNDGSLEDVMYTLRTSHTRLSSCPFLKIQLMREQENPMAIVNVSRFHNTCCLS